MEIVAILYALVYLGMAFVVSRWNRGVLPVAAGLAVLFAVVAAVAGPAWFDRDKAGFDVPALEPSILGMLTLILVPVQLLLVAFVAASSSSGTRRSRSHATRPTATPRPAAASRSRRSHGGSRA